MNKSNPHTVSKELTHQYHIINMLSTIYEKLHNKYRFKSRFLNIILLLTSLMLCLTTFVDSKILLYLEITPEKGQMILGISSLVVFAIAITAFINDWKGKANSFGHATETLNKIQIDCQEQLKLEHPEESPDIHVKSLVYSSIINHLPKLPERDFHKLKAFHKRQMELDKMIDLYPGSSVWLLRIFTFFRANIHVLLRKPFINNASEENISK